MDIDTFTSTVWGIYNALPYFIKDKISIQIQEEKPDIIDGIVFGYVSQYLGEKTLFLCYWGFKETGNFSKEHISNVINHEIQHYFEGLDGSLARQEEKVFKSITVKKQSEKIKPCWEIIILFFFCYIWTMLAINHKEMNSVTALFVISFIYLCVFILFIKFFRR